MMVTFYLAKLGEIGASHACLDANLDLTSGDVHETRDVNGQLEVALGPRTIAYELDPNVVGHLHASQRMRTLELLFVEDVLVENVAFGRDPLLGLDGYDVASAHDLFAVPQAVVHADVDDRVGLVEERDERHTCATLVREYATLLVQLALVLVENFDCDFLARVTRRHRRETRVLDLL